MAFLHILTSLILIGLVVKLIRFDTFSQRISTLKINDEIQPGFKIVVARSWINRRLGLLNHASLASNAGLWLCNTSRIHTRGMLFAIDVVFLNAKGQVTKIIPDIPPSEIKIQSSSVCGSAVEFASGVALNTLRLKVGDRLECV